MKSAAFQHLLKHYRGVKSELAYAIETFKTEGEHASEFRIAAEIGAMKCLYCQALGLGEVNLAKGIRRTLIKAGTTY